MNKELENLKELEMWATNGYTACEVEKAKELVMPIEKVLKDYENTKDRLDETQALFWKYQKALEIIKKYKGIEILGTNYLGERKVRLYNGLPITEEEYEILKEVMHGN